MTPFRTEASLPSGIFRMTAACGLPTFRQLIVNPGGIRRHFGGHRDPNGKCLFRDSIACVSASDNDAVRSRGGRDTADDARALAPS